MSVTRIPPIPTFTALPPIPLDMSVSSTNSNAIEPKTTNTAAGDRGIEGRDCLGGGERA